MKRCLYLLFFVFVLSATAFGQWTNASFTFEGKLRSYRTYKPESYNPAIPTALLVVLHGLGGSMNDAAGLNVSSIADTANIILLSPQALDYNSPFGTIAAAWNSGIELNIPGLGNFPVNSDINDVGFIASMMDSTMAAYNIDANRVYVCGASMGGFMTQRLACTLPGRFKAIASVMGTYALALPPCAPQKILPMAHFHGTADDVVGYDGSFQFGTNSFPVGLSVDLLVSKWVTINGCSSNPVHTVWPDGNNDNLFVTHDSYLDNQGVSRVELFKINNGLHQWYGYAATAGEFDYGVEIWKFFNKQYAADGTGMSDERMAKTAVTVYPNPARDFIRIQSAIRILEITVTDVYGRPQAVRSVATDGFSIRDLTPGNYFIQMTGTNGEKAFTKFIKQ